MLKRLRKIFIINKSFNKRLYSYIIIAVLAIVTNLVGYQVTIDNLENSLLEKNRNEAELVKNTCDSFFYEIQTVAYSLQQSGSVRKMARETLSDYERQVLTDDIIHEIEGRIRQIAVDNMAVIFRDKDLYVSNQIGSSKIDFAYDLLYSTHFKTQDEFLDSIYSTSGWSIFTKTANETVSDTDDASERLYLVFHMPTMNQQIAIVAQINQKQLSKLLIYKDSVDQVLLLNRNDDVLYGDESVIDFKHKDAMDLDRYVYNGERYITNTVNSDVLPIIYVRMIPEDVYSSSIKETRTAFILGYILCLLLALACGAFFSKIEEAREKKLIMRLEEESRKVNETLLRKLLVSNEVLDSYNEEKLRKTWDGKYFIVMLFDFMDNLEDYTKSTPQRIEPYFLSSYLGTKISGLFADGKVGFFTINDMCTGVLNFTQLMETSEMKGVCEKICNSIGEEFDIDLRCALSNVVEDTKELHAAFENVREIMNFRFLGDDKIVFVYDDIMVGQGLKPLRLQIDNSLFKVISEQGDGEKACSIINDCFHECMECQTTLSETRMILLDIISILLKVIAQEDIITEIDCKPLYVLTTNMSGTHQLREAWYAILRYTKELCHIIEAKKNQDLSELVLKVTEFIENNYSNPNLNVNIIADEFGRNRSSLSKRFRAETGVVLSEYIICYRLERAKEYLAQGDTINAVVEKTGFSSTVVFYRAFKKHLGMSPAEYKKMAIQKSND